MPKWYSAISSDFLVSVLKITITYMPRVEDTLTTVCYCLYMEMEVQAEMESTHNRSSEARTPMIDCLLLRKVVHDLSYKVTKRNTTLFCALFCFSWTKGRWKMPQWSIDLFPIIDESGRIFWKQYALNLPHKTVLL